MQIKADVTKEQFLKSSNPLAEAWYPIGRIKLIADMINCIEEDEFDSGNVFNQDNAIIMANLIKDACEEIECLIDIKNK